MVNLTVGTGWPHRRRLFPEVPAIVGAHGFTLIELLVDMAIISVLVAMLFPARARARGKARRAVCLAGAEAIEHQRRADVWGRRP